MLRSLVVLFVALNVALFLWIRSSPTWGQSEREPQRLQRQVSPGSIQVLPDLPTGAAPTAADASPGVEGGFAPPAAGPARPAASTAAIGSTAAAASAPLRRPSAAFLARSAGSR